MTRDPFIAHSELTNEIYIVTDKEKYRVTEQVIKAVIAIKALKQEPILDKIRAEILKLDDADYDFEGYYKAVTDALAIIDKYRGEEDETDN